MPIAIIILSFTLIAIAIRRVVRITIPIWAIMLVAALCALAFQQITPTRALKSIEPEVMFYLFGVFLISQAAEESGYLAYLTDKIFYYAKTGKQALLLIVFILGLAAALLMNDTMAIVGTPIILQLCKSHKRLIKPLLFALAFSITIGSAMSPIGNPQNLLIAIKSGMPYPFVDFMKELLIPTLFNLLLTYFFIYIIYKELLNEPIEKPVLEPISHHKTAFLVKISMWMMLVLIGTKVCLDALHTSTHMNFSYIALLSALPLIFTNQLWCLIKKLDWGTLIFFASTFVLMQSVWDSGFFQDNITYFHLSLTQIPTIVIVSLVLSQFISNVPLVALYLPLLLQHAPSNASFLALAIGSTIAGNLSILGAASNVIIIQNSEKRGIKSFGFFEFIKLGLPLTLINLLVYSYFIKM